MERGKSSLAQMQLNFIDYLVVPLFATLAGMSSHFTKTKNTRTDWSKG
jgi:hypothetical protein